MRERELKFLVPEGFSLDGVELGGKLRMVPASDSRFETVYMDTPDLRLAGWGCSLRHRSGEGWTLKLPRAGVGHLVEREEVEFPDEPADGGPPSTALRLGAAFVRTAHVGPTVRLRATRRTASLEDHEGGAVLGLITLDDVQVMGRGGWRFRELEIELHEGVGGAVVDRVAKRLRAAGAEPERVSKYLRALGARAPREPEVAPPAVDRSSSTVELVRAALGRSTARLMLHDPFVRLGGDEEAVHRARVGSRRLRSDLRTFRSQLEPGWARGLGADLRQIGRRLGGLRDADVMLDRIRGHIDAEASVDPGAADELLRALARRRRRLRLALIEAMDDPRYVELIERLVAAAANPHMSDQADARGRVPVPALLVPPAGRLREAVERCGDLPSDKRLHRVRINAKRLRYAAEAVAPVAAQPVSRVAKAAARVQDVLGEHQDAVVAATWLRTRPSRSGRGTALPARLERAEREAATAARGAWPAAWGKLERAMNAAGL